VVSGRQRLLSPADQGKVVMLAILTNNVPSSSAPVRARYQPGAFAEWFPERDPDLDRPHPTDPTQSTENKVSRSRTNQPAASGRAIVMSGGPTDALNPGCMHSPKVFCNGEPASSLKTSMRAGAILPSEIVLGPLTDMRLTAIWVRLAHFAQARSSAQICTTRTARSDHPTTGAKCPLSDRPLAPSPAQQRSRTGKDACPTAPPPPDRPSSRSAAGPAAPAPPPDRISADPPSARGSPRNRAYS